LSSYVQAILGLDETTKVKGQTNTPNPKRG